MNNGWGKLLRNFPGIIHNSLFIIHIRITSHVMRPLQLFVSNMVSGLFHRPQRTAFHLSLAVLVHYRSRWVFSLTG